MRAKYGHAPDYEKNAAKTKQWAEQFQRAQKKRRALKKIAQNQNPVFTAELYSVLEKEENWKYLFLKEQNHWKKLMATYQGMLWKKAFNKMADIKRRVKRRLIAEHAKRTPPQVVADFRSLLQADQPKEKPNDTDQR